MKTPLSRLKTATAFGLLCIAKMSCSPAVVRLPFFTPEINAISVIIRHKIATISFLGKTKPPHIILKIICGGKAFNDLLLLGRNGVPDST